MYQRAAQKNSKEKIRQVDRALDFPEVQKQAEKPAEEQQPAKKSEKKDVPAHAAIYGFQHSTPIRGFEQQVSTEHTTTYAAPSPPDIPFHGLFLSPIFITARLDISRENADIDM
ncbi:MAG: hypothetical protein IH600_01200 [Bacteroidetes bacterium]|nr:hypothetical protein [Bacteroidota bacterium]